MWMSCCTCRFRTRRLNDDDGGTPASTGAKNPGSPEETQFSSWVVLLYIYSLNNCCIMSSVSLKEFCQVCEKTNRRCHSHVINMISAWAKNFRTESMLQTCGCEVFRYLSGSESLLKKLIQLKWSSISGARPIVLLQFWLLFLLPPTLWNCNTKSLEWPFKRHIVKVTWYYR